MEEAIRNFLLEWEEQYNQGDFIAQDPISIPHRFKRKEDIEISGFIVATLAWGTRKSILKSGNRLIEIMDSEPAEFVLHATESDLRKMTFVHRTFNAEDLLFFIRSLRNIYKNHGGLEGVFSEKSTTIERLIHFRKVFLSVDHSKRSEKHVSDPQRGSSCKRLNMFLRWMVRSDNRGVDFGLWKKIKPSGLVVPLDVHTGRVARMLRLTIRKQNDWTTAIDVTEALKEIDPGDPVRFDFALFGSGVNARKFDNADAVILS